MTIGAPWLELVGSDSPEHADHERVLNGALAAFLDYGIRRTSMGEIARRSGVSPATLYRRFTGKDDVVWAVGRREARRLISRVEHCVDAESGAEDQIVAAFIAAMDGIRSNPLLQRLLTTEPEVVLPLLTIHAGPVLELGRAFLSDFIRRLQRDDGLPEFDPDPVAEMLARVALSMAVLPRTCIPLENEDAVRAFTRRHLAAMVGWSAPPSP